MREELRRLYLEMIRFDADPDLIQHFTKVHSYAKLIGEEEGMEPEALFALEAAAMGLGSEHITITALFTLMFYSALIWYIKTLLRTADEGLLRDVASWNAIILFVVMLLGLRVCF